MQSIVAYLLATVVASQARWINPGYGMGGSVGSGAPVALVAYHGIPAAVPAVISAYGTSTQYHAQDELGQARFRYAHPGQAALNYRAAMGNQIGSYAYFEVLVLAPPITEASSGVKLSKRMG